MTPEQKARVSIDTLLQQVGWHVCHMAQANIHAARGVALREFPLNPGYGFADYLLYIDGKAAGVIEAKKEGSTLSGVEIQSARHAQGLPASLTNGRMQEITGEHSKDITGVLQNLARDGLLTQQNQRRWASYRVAEDSPQSSPNWAGTPLVRWKAPLIRPRNSCHWQNPPDSSQGSRRQKCRHWFYVCVMPAG